MPLSQPNEEASVAVWSDVKIATMEEGGVAYGLIENGAIVAKDGTIDWVGSSADLPSQYNDAPHQKCNGQIMTPGLVDCHTHLVYGGNRVDEFEQRMLGVSYEDIARAGGGIISTVKATRDASEDSLFLSAQKRLKQLQQSGVTTVEIKSGYGLDTENELKMLRVARRLGGEKSVDVQATFLGAHAVPPSFNGDSDAYMDLVCNEMLPAVAGQGLADAVDAFCENIAFSAVQVERLFKRAQELGLPVKLHAEQLTNGGGSALAAKYGALSSDHLECLDEQGIAAMAEAGTAAVLLPGAYYFLRDNRVPPIEMLRQYGVPMAVASDSNPGSSPVLSLPLMVNMATTLFGLTPEEALAGVTRNGARALGFSDRGVLRLGSRADFALWDISSPAELAYQIGGNSCTATIKNGVTVN